MRESPVTQLIIHAKVRGENNVFIVAPKLLQSEMNKERGNAAVVSQVFEW